MDTKKAIKDIQGLLEEIENARYGSIEGINNYRLPQISLRRLYRAKEALALLKPPAAEPEAGEFVKTAREFFIEAFNGEAIPADIYTQGLELCSLLEAAQSEKRLLRAEGNAAASALLDVQDDCVKARQRIAELEAEKKGLVEDRNRLFVLNESPKNLPSKCRKCGTQIDYTEAGYSDI